MKRFLFFLFLALLWMSSASANVPCSVPFNLLNGTTADATQVMANYNAILTCLQNAAIAGANNDITALNGLTTPLSRNQGGSPIFIGGTSVGSANAQSVTIAAPTGFSLTAGNGVIFLAGFTNTGPMTLTVNATTATNMFTFQQSGAPAAMLGGEVQAGQLAFAVFDGTQFQLMNASPNFNYHPISSSYTVTNLDCGKQLVFFPPSQMTLTVPAASALGNCTIRLQNGNAWAAKAGVLLNVSGYVTDPKVLYPTMTMDLTAQGGSFWQQSPLPVSTAVPLNTFLYVNGNTGVDGNDCLTQTTACQSLQYVFMTLLYHNLLTISGSSSPTGGSGGVPGIDVRLLADPSCVATTGLNCIHGLHWSGIGRALEGHNSAMIECDAGSPVNCTVADNTGGQAIGVYCSCYLELRNVTLGTGNGQNNTIQVERGMVRLEGGVTLGPTGSNPQLSAIFQGAIVNEGGVTLTVSGGTSNALAQVAQGGSILFDSSTVSFAAATTYAATLQGLNGVISANGTTWSNGGSVTAPNNVQCAPGGFVTTNGALASVPGTNTLLGCVNSPSGQAN